MNAPKPDYLYDPEDWEATYAWSDRDEMESYFELTAGYIKEVGTLYKGARYYAVCVVLTRDDHGDPDETEVQWFDNEDDAKKAAGQ